MPTTSSIPVSAQTRRRVKAAKRSGQTYEEVVLEMLRQYDPSKADSMDPNSEDGQDE